MTNAMLTLAALCVVLSPLPALAIPPGPDCHLRLAGRFVATNFISDYDMRVAVRLTVHGDPEGPPYLYGRMRCTSRDKNKCLLADGKFVANLNPHPDRRNLIGFRTHFTIPRRGGSSGDVCELEAVTGYFRGCGCFGALIGTFVCPPEGVIPVSGNFGWTVDTCPPRRR